MCNITAGRLREPRRAAAEPRHSWTRRRRPSRPRASGSRAAGDRLRRARLLRRRPKACMGGWGRRFINVTPVGQGDAVPRRRDTARASSSASVRDESLAEIWYELRGVRAVPRHRLDAGAVPLLRPARDRLGRLPLPGLRLDRRRRAHRSRLRPRPRPRAIGARPRRGGRNQFRFRFIVGLPFPARLRRSPARSRLTPSARVRARCPPPPPPGCAETPAGPGRVGENNGDDTSQHGVIAAAPKALTAWRMLKARIESAASAFHRLEPSCEESLAP